MDRNQIKNGEKQSNNDLNTQKTKSADGNIGITADKVQESDKVGKSNTDKQLSTLNKTLKNMIHTSNKAEAPFETSLTGFYKEISKSIKRK